MKVHSLLILLCLSGIAQAGFGIQVGAFSPTTGLEDNDNSVLFGAHFKQKFTIIGIKAEAFFVDSSGTYSDILGDEFGQTDVDVEAFAAVDLLYYPIGTTLFIQGGLNYTVLDAKKLVEIDQEVIDNQLGLDLGVGITLFDKLMVQGKMMYTPNAINSDVVDVLKDIDENLFGYVVSIGWQF